MQNIKGTSRLEWVETAAADNQDSPRDCYILPPHLGAPEPHRQGIAHSPSTPSGPWEKGGTLSSEMLSQDVAAIVPTQEESSSCLLSVITRYSA